MLDDDVKRRLKTAELEAKKSRLRMWTSYVPPVSNSKAIHDQNFTGKVGYPPCMFKSMWLLFFNFFNYFINNFNVF